MDYKGFKSLIQWLNETGLTIDKETLGKVLNINSFTFSIKDALVIIMSDDTLQEKEKFVDLLVKVGNDSLLPSSVVDILRDKNIRENDYYINAIMSQDSYDKRKNLVRALKNKQVLENLDLFNYISDQDNKDIQRRIVAIVEFDLGISMLGKVQSATNEEEVTTVLSEVEQAIVEEEKRKLEQVAKQVIDNPTREGIIALSSYQKSLDRVITDYHNTELSMDLPEVTGKGPKALIFTPKNNDY